MQFNEVLYAEIGQKISAVRKLHKDSQDTLAVKVGLKRSTVSNIEVGRLQITLHLLYRIAQIYNLEVYELIPKVNAIACKVSLQYEDLNEKLKDQDVGEKTMFEIKELLKK